MQPPREWPELGSDQLDRPRAARPAWRWLAVRHPALGVSPTPVPALLFVLLGATLGPHGVNVLTAGALNNVQAIGWVALAVIGVFTGLGIGTPGAIKTPRIVAGSIAVALLTAAAVAGGFTALVVWTGVPVPGSLAAAAVLVGLCASASAALHTSDGTPAAVFRAARLAQFDDLPVLIIGVAVIAAGASGTGAAVRLLATVAAGVAIGVAGWLLFERSSDGERGVFVTGAILLLAGSGAYLGTSPLLLGCVAAIVWARAPGAADRITARDLQTLQHPLVALLLVIAGALIEWTTLVLWLAACLVVLRLAAKLLASVVAAPVAGVSPALLATILLPPGVMGVALSLNASSLLGADYAWLVSTVTVATVASELLATLLPDATEDAA